ncbi:MAG: hypothetical protein ABI665_05570 [Vicinamibacterales bacterium]
MAAALLGFSAACSFGNANTYAFPDTIQFGSENLTRATTSKYGGTASAVYVAPGEALPQAALQVGAIVSTEHATANDLHYWIIGQYYASGVSPMYDSDTIGEACKVGLAPEATRTFMSLMVCKTGVSRAACVEADETLDAGTFTTCINKGDACFADVCDRRWLERREALDALVADVLSRR